MESPSEATPEQSTAKAAPSERSLWALLATVLLPGLGHALRGHAMRGVYFLLSLLALWFLFTVLSAWWLIAVPGAFVATIAWFSVCAFDAYRLQKRDQPTKAWFVFAGVAGVTWLIAPMVMSAVVRMVSIEAFKVPGGSMCPTLEVGDHMFVDKTAYRGDTPARGDVVVYESEQGVAFVHRVVAVAGQEVQVDTSGRVAINGEATKLEATKETACGGAATHTEAVGTPHQVVLGDAGGLSAKLRVPAGHVFVLGDNRPNSADSRTVGTVPKDAIVGRAHRLYLRAGSLRFSKID
jgi:signal peptidase I